MKKFKRQAGQLLMPIMVVGLLAASLNLNVGRVLADDDIPGTPTFTEIVDTPTEVERTPSPTETVTPAESTPTENPVSQTPTETYTAAPRLQGSYVSDQVLVRFKNTATEADISDCLEQVNGRIDAFIEELSVTVIRLDLVSVSNAVATLSACPGVRYVEPNYLAFGADTIPTDPGWSNQYGLVNIHAPQGWDLATGSSSVVIAIVDSGVDLGHADLAAKIVPGYDFVNNDSNPQDDNGHGTHVAGIAAAVSNNGAGMSGVSWGARIMPVKVLNAAGGGTFANVAAGIVWASDHGAQIINLSVGGSSSSVVLQNAVNYAVNNGALIVAASGNTGSNLVLFPAAYPNVIAVGATDFFDSLAAFSNYGPEMDLVAPGVSIYSTNIGGGYTYRNGTSMAAPFVAGLAAILRGMPGSSAGTVRTIMEGTALDLGPGGWDNLYGNGLIQMDSAILLALPATRTPRLPTHTPQVFLPGGFLPTFTLTPSPTLPLTLPVSASPSITPSQTLDSSANPGDLDTMTPEIIALETQTPRGSAFGRELLFPSCGLLLLLAGLLLFWFGSRGRKKPHRGSYL